jgi:hypothetical protein
MGVQLAGYERGQILGTDRQALSLVRGSSPHRVLQVDHVGTEGSRALRLADKVLFEADPSFGYLTVSGLLRFNKNTAQRIFQEKGWQFRNRAVGYRQRIEALPSVARIPT